MIRLIVEKHNIREAYGVPCEGIFWLIDNDLIVYTDPVNIYIQHRIFLTINMFGNLLKKNMVMLHLIITQEGVLWLIQ